MFGVKAEIRSDQFIGDDDFERDGLALEDRMLFSTKELGGQARQRFGVKLALARDILNKTDEQIQVALFEQSDPRSTVTVTTVRQMSGY